MQQQQRQRQQKTTMPNNTKNQKKNKKKINLLATQDVSNDAVAIGCRSRFFSLPFLSLRRLFVEF